jgi:hypothetical protein
LSDFEDYLAQAEAKIKVVAIAQGISSIHHSVPVLSARQQRDANRERQHANWERQLQSEKSCSRGSGSDDDLPIVNTLPSSTAPKKKKKRAPKTLWTYEPVVASSSPASKYWDVQMLQKRATKRLGLGTFMQDDAASEINTSHNAKNCTKSCSDDDDLPIVNLNHFISSTSDKKEVTTKNFMDIRESTRVHCYCFKILGRRNVYREDHKTPG